MSTTPHREAAPRTRGPGTARTVLDLLRLLAAAPDGLAAAEVADGLGKSPSTAYSLLDTLREARFVLHAPGGVYRLTADAAGVVPQQATRALPRGLLGVVDELLERTHKRSYLALVRGGRLMVPLVRGRQGMPLIPGMGAEIGDSAHAVALGKVALSLLDELALQRYVSRGLRSFTPATVTAPDLLRAELEEIRAGAVAADREEFAPDVCCLASAVHGPDGRPIAAIGISMSARCFELDHETLAATVRDVAERASLALGAPRPDAVSEDPHVLELPQRPGLGSAEEARHSPAPFGEEVKS